MMGKQERMQRTAWVNMKHTHARGQCSPACWYWAHMSGSVSSVCLSLLTHYLGFSVSIPWQEVCSSWHCSMSVEHELHPDPSERCWQGFSRVVNDFGCFRPALSSYSLSGCPSRQGWRKHVEVKHQNESSSIISSCEKSWCIPLKVAQNNPIHSVSGMLSSHRNLKIGKFTRLRKFNGNMNHVDLYCCRLVTVCYRF